MTWRWRRFLFLFKGEFDYGVKCYFGDIIWRLANGLEHECTPLMAPHVISDVAMKVWVGGEFGECVSPNGEVASPHTNHNEHIPLIYQAN